MPLLWISWVSAKIADGDTEFVGRLGKLIDTKLDTCRDEFRAGNNDNQNVKSIAEKYLEPRAFKKKENEKQFTINAQVLECFDQAVSAVDKNKLDKSKETLKTGIEILKTRQKLILFADSEKLGWRVAYSIVLPTVPSHTSVTPVATSKLSTSTTYGGFINSELDFSETDFSLGEEFSTPPLSTGCSLPTPVSRLHSNLDFWKHVTQSQMILCIIQSGYIIPFYNFPPTAFLSNNRSALLEKEFVFAEIKALLDKHCVSKVSTPPTVINPLSVSHQREGKLRLILDLRHVNEYVMKQTLKLEDITQARQLFSVGDFMYTFDIKSAYHHIPIHDHCKQFLGFSWPCYDQIAYYVFNVLPFGLSSAVYMFTKITKALTKKWRSQGISILMYLDDVLGAAHNKEMARQQASQVRRDSLSAGFLLSEEKCDWELSQSRKWLGHIINLETGMLQVSQERVESLKLSISHRFDSLHFKNGVAKAKLEKVSSLHHVLGSAGCLHTKYMYFAIESCSSWFSLVQVSPTLKKELNFWLSQISTLNSNLWQLLENKCQVFDLYIWSDAFQVGHIFLSHENWSDEEQAQRTTWRELKAVNNLLLTFVENTKNQSVAWNTDNQNVPRIIASGSTKRDLHSLAIEIDDICKSNHIALQVTWIPRNQNEAADVMNKLIDKDDWSLDQGTFLWLDSIWGHFTIDRFTTHYNTNMKDLIQNFGIQTPRLLMHFRYHGQERITG